MAAVTTSGMGAKIKMSVGGTLSGNNFCAVYGIVNNVATTTGGAVTLSTTVTYANVSTANGDYTIWEGSFTTTTSGAFTVQMAQNVSTGTNLILQDRAYLLVTQLN